MNPSFQNWAADRRFKGLVFLVLALAAVALLSFSYLSLKQSKYVNNYGPTVISVRGVGEVTKMPDIATFSFSVHAEASDPAAAQTSSAESTNAILAYLKENGIKEEDIKTTSYNLSPQYDYSTRPCMGNVCPPQGPPQITGYTVDQMVQVKVRDTAKAGSLISGVGERGATDVTGLAFTVDDDTDAKAEARGKAIADARQKAETLARTLNVRLVRLNGFYEEEGGPFPYEKAYGGDMMSADAAMPAPVAPEIPSGEHMTTVTVNLTYEIR